jgi:hypothetical protein
MAQQGNAARLTGSGVDPVTLDKKAVIFHWVW